jgi:hypothetical protein
MWETCCPKKRVVVLLKFCSFLFTYVLITVDRFLFIGASGVGKRSILRRILDNTFSDRLESTWYLCTNSTCVWQLSLLHKSCLLLYSVILPCLLTTCVQWRRHSQIRNGKWWMGRNTVVQKDARQDGSCKSTLQTVHQGGNTIDRFCI